MSGYNSKITSSQNDALLDNRNNQNVAIKSPTTAFGEVEMMEKEPSVQLHAIYGIQTDIVETFTGSSGLVYTSGSMFVCETETNIGGYGVIRSSRPVKYKPGFGNQYRITALFDNVNNVANSFQFAGAFNAGNALGFGYDGPNFGILHQYGGEHAIYQLNLSVGAGGAEIGTIVLNNVTSSFALTAGNTKHQAYEIANTGSIFTGWDVTRNDSKVVFFKRDVGKANGNFYFTSTGASAGTFTTIASGASDIKNWISQSAWNIDTMDGNGPSGRFLKHNLGNVYQINQQFLGFGNIDFFIEDDERGDFIKVHELKYANRNTEPSLKLPQQKIGWAAASLGSTSNVVQKGASAAGCVQGRSTILKPSRSQDASGSITTSFSPLLSIRVRYELNSGVNLGECFPNLLSIASDSSKSTIYTIYKNSTLTGEPDWNYVDQDQSIVEYDVTATGRAGGELVSTFVVGPNSSEIIDQRSFNLYLLRGESLVVIARVTSGAASIGTVSLVWLEEL